MSTRSVIARQTLVKESKVYFKGVYHHWDGYPSGLGASLFKKRKEYFKGDTELMLHTLIDEHPAGWSSIVQADFSKAVGYRNSNNLSDKEIKESYLHPQCFCHGDRHEDPWPVNQKNAQGSGCEYAYVFKGNTMKILSSYCKDGAKMIGMFGMGDPEATWKIIAEVDLNGKEPDWKKIQGFS